MKPIHRTVLQMREQEKTYVEICQETGLAKSTISYILQKHFPRSKNKAIYDKKQRTVIGRANHFLSEANRRKARLKADEFYQQERTKLKEYYLELLRDFPDQCFIHYVSGLYEGEGRHTTTEFDFCNSDPKLIMPFLYFLRETLGFPESRFTLRLALHSSLSKEKCISYWENVCAHQVDAVDQYDSRPQKKVHKHHKDRKFYGTLSVRVKQPNGLKSALKEYTY